jgi:FkbM family methyltransferase
MSHRDRGSAWFPVLAALLALTGCSRAAGQSQRCVFIDGGAHFGESYTAFQKTELFKRYTWDIIAIEANPKLAEKLPKAPRATVLAKAIWTNDGTLDFHMENDISGANSIYDRFKENATTLTVPSIDFSQWVQKTVKPEDYVILSLDIEGAEYDVMDKMLKDGTFKYIDRLYVEFHPYLQQDITRNQADKRGRVLLKDIEKQGVIVADDSAEGVMKRGDWIDFLL